MELLRKKDNPENKVLSSHEYLSDRTSISKAMFLVINLFAKPCKAEIKLNYNNDKRLRKVIFSVLDLILVCPFDNSAFDDIFFFLFFQYTVAMMGYGPEDKSTVLELTYNYGVKEYTKGNAYAQVSCT